MMFSDAKLFDGGFQEPVVFHLPSTIANAEFVRRKQKTSVQYLLFLDTVLTPVAKIPPCGR